jgi:hypothetical protein
VKQNLQRHLILFYNFESLFIFGQFVKFSYLPLIFLKEVPPLYGTEANKGHSEGQNPVCWFPVAHNSNEARNQQQQQQI